MTTPPPSSAAFALLDRHERRRTVGVPTVSVLAGPVDLAMQTARRWAEARRRPVAPIVTTDAGGAVVAWVEGLASGRDLVRDAAARLARRSGRDGVEVERRTPHELAVLLESAPSLTAADVACRAILEGSAAGDPPDPARLVARLDAALSERGPRWIRALLALHELVPAEGLPILLLARPAGASPESAWVESAARLLSGLAEAQPALTVLLAIDPADLDTYHRLAPESRAKASLREAVLPIAGPRDEPPGPRPDVAPPAEAGDVSRSLRRLADDGASDRLIELFREAALRAAPPDPARDDEARSAAERFLFERLRSLPATAGLFRLNEALDFRFGPAAAEVDLLARGLALAVEVDGYYHFRDADAYRRDRRKDFELQRRGFLVVRVLADDVVRRLDDVLDLILSAVTSRRDRVVPPRGRTP